MVRNSKEDGGPLIPEGAPSSVTETIPRGQKLPDDLQKLVDKQDTFMDELYDGQYGSYPYPSPYLYVQGYTLTLCQGLEIPPRVPSDMPPTPTD